MPKRKASSSSTPAVRDSKSTSPKYPIAPSSNNSKKIPLKPNDRSPSTLKSITSSPPKIIMPTVSENGATSLQKRRRVVRACDRCRKLKIKCSGDLPCIHCTVYSYECTYDQPNRSKKKGANPTHAKVNHNNNDPTTTSTTTSTSSSTIKSPLANSVPLSTSSSSFSSNILPTTLSPEMMAKLTDRLKLYDDILHRLVPTIKLTDLNDNPKPINPMKLMSALNKLREEGKDDTVKSAELISDTYNSLPDIPVPKLPLQKLPPKQPEQTVTNLQQSQDSPSSLSERVLSNSPTGLEPGIDGSYESSMGKEIKIILPSREVALQLITKTWENACVLFRFYHRPAFVEDLNELYDTDPGQYTNKQQRFLPLVYSVMACGALFFKSDEQTTGGKIDGFPNNENFEDEGYRYFIAARKLIDITDTRDTYGIQTIVMLIIFLQCSARLSTCYAYIGIALRAALREGLHRKLDFPFNPIELEIRKRLFWTIYKMDIYVNTMLGLPRTISEDDFDQDIPIELDDENITVTGYRYDRQGDRLSSSGIANAHTKLIFIMKKIVTKLYPIKPLKIEDGTRPELLAHNIVYDLELELQDWMNHLPLELKPGVEPPGQYLKANRLLHISYLHVKIILYRPFIHYISTEINTRQPKSMNDLRSIEKAKNCINVARIVVKLAEDMIDKKMLSGSYWFSIYTIFFSVACLVYYVHFVPPINKEGKEDPEYMAIKKDAENGKRVLDILKDSSMAAKRTYNILNALFEQLNRNTANSRHDPSEPLPSQQLQQHGSQQSQQFITPQMGEPLKDNSNSYKPESTGINNGVNYIDGIATGVNLSLPEFSNSNDNNNIPYSDLTQQQQQHLQQHLNQRQQHQQQSSSPQQQHQTNSKYVPGPMDQLDMKIFGRFLPPYMLHQDHSTSTDNIGNSTLPQDPQVGPLPRSSYSQQQSRSQPQQQQRYNQTQPQPQPQTQTQTQPQQSQSQSTTGQPSLSQTGDFTSDFFSQLTPVPSGLATVGQSSTQRRLSSFGIPNTGGSFSGTGGNSGTNAAGEFVSSSYSPGGSSFDQKNLDFDDFLFGWGNANINNGLFGGGGGGNGAGADDGNKSGGTNEKS